MKVNYAKHVSAKNTPQTEPLLGQNQIKNSAGGYVYKIDDWQRLDRFLILGAEGGTYYVGEKKLVADNAKTVLELIKHDGNRVIQRTVEISEAGRAPKNDPAIFVLALCSAHGDETTRKAAAAAVSKVCRTGTHLFHFAEYVNALRGWGRSVKRAVQNWYLEKEPNQLAYQLFKYKSRDGWSHRDLLRLSKPKSADAAIDALFGHAVGKPKEVPDSAGEWVNAVLSLPNRSISEIVELVQRYNLPREVLPTEALNAPEVWEAMLPKMPATALLRNLATMTRVGVVKPLSAGNRVVLDKLNDHAWLCKARVHPIAVLSALMTYQRGCGFRSENTWEPVPQIVDALEEAFYGTFKAVEPCGKGVLLALDVSGSMSGGDIAGVPGLSPAMATAALALVTARTEPNYHIVGFASEIKDLRITAKDTITTALRKVHDQNFGSTDCAAAFKWALKNKIEAQLIAIYTDNETWAGGQHVSVAQREYRNKMQIPARSVAVGMTATECSINDPEDPLSLNIVGFDSACPQMISDFGAGR